MIVRPLGAALMVFGAALAVMPALSWFSVRTPNGRVQATGLDAAGDLWLVAALGGLTVLAGAALLACRPEGAPGLARWLGPAVVAAGVLALVWSVRAGVDPPVGLTVIEDGAPRALPVPLHVEPAAVIASVVAAVLVAFGGAVAWTGWRP